MARATGASMLLLRVVEPPESPASANAVARMLTRVASELSADGLRVESAVYRGQPSDVIFQQVDKQAVDLVVMRTRGHSGIQRAVMGSIAERLLSRRDVPIVMLRPGGRRMDRIANL